MKIARIHTWPVTFEVRPEFYIVSSAGAHRVSRYVIVGIETDDGYMGWGEASVVPEWSGETQGGAKALIEDYFAAMLVGRDPSQIQALASAMDAIVGNPFTKAAIEMALLDLAAKIAGQPLYQFLEGPKNPRRIPIKFSIGLREPQDAATIAAGKVKQGFTAIKIKVGPDPEKDFQRVAAVREAIGPKVQLTIDVNGGWSIERAIREAPRYEELGVACLEQPTPRWDIEAMAIVRRAVKVPIMADESVFTVWDAEQVLERKAADLISIYPGKNGGLLRAMEICRKAEAAGIGCHIGSNLEWDIGTAAMCHLACACQNIRVQDYPVDILGPLYYGVRPQHTPMAFGAGYVTVPEGPGLGVRFTREELEAVNAS